VNNDEKNMFPKPVVVVSRCLEFEPVRYNAQIMPCPLVKDLEPFVEYIKVCPEYEIGLGVPRDPIRIVKQNNKLHLIQPKTKEDITDKMNQFTLNFIQHLPEVDGFIFKSDSPTIGLRNIKIYSGIEKAPVVQRGHGFFAGQLLNTYPDYPMEEDNRLRNNTIRHHFLVKLFTFAGFRRIKNKHNLDLLKDFHMKNNFLYSLYNPDYPKQGKKILEKKDESIDSIEVEYFDSLKKLFSTHPQADDYLRVWNKLIDYIQPNITGEEKKFMNSILTKYQNNKICQTGVTDMLYSFAIRFPDDFIEKQTIFSPYPEPLLPTLEPKRDKNYWK
jgi:uncharacterized protein YbbK (DUF523 family)/uncharacterized protein YbgA (DUF1722 family)